MNLYLADACALIEFYGRRPGFPARVRSLLENQPATVAVVIKTALGKLVDLRDPTYPTLTDMLAAHGYGMLPFDHATAEQAANLPPLHADPFDRALVATAQRTCRTVLTPDRTIGRYGVPVSW